MYTNFLKDESFFILDFDHTITTGDSASTFGMFRESGYMSDEFIAENSSLYEFYHQYEIDHSLTQQQRGKYMFEWHFQSFELLKKHRLSHITFQKILESQMYLMKLRNGLQDFLEQAYHKNIPIIIFSAGMYPMIEYFLKNIGVGYPNIFIIANPMYFTQEGYFSGVDMENFIYATEKNWKLLEKLLDKKILERKNCILVGDMVDDMTMAPDSESGYNLHSIGIINRKHQHLTQVYDTFFDEYVLDDASEQGKLVKILNTL